MGFAGRVAARLLGVGYNDLVSPSRISSSPNSNSNEVVAGLENVLGRELDEMWVGLSREQVHHRIGNLGDGLRAVDGSEASDRANPYT